MPVEVDEKRATSRLLRKLDWNLMPLLSGLYLLSFLDRSNVGNARLAGLEKDLGLSGLDYNVVLSAFFPWYVAADVPSNLAMKAFRPSIWIPSIMVAWGLVCTLMGIVHNYAGLLAARMALGLTQGGLFPGINFYITMWYKRHECGLRMAIFFSAATAAGAFGGLLALGIMKMDGAGHVRGWAWIFIIEGLVTIVFGVLAFFGMHDYPETANFLTEHERQALIRRLESDRGALDDSFRMRYVWDAIKDWKIWTHTMITIGIYTPLYSISLFLPTIVKTFTESPFTAQLLTVPPYVVACILCIGAGFAADRQGQRGIYMVAFCLVALAGFLLLMVTTNDRARYFGCFLITGGIYPNVSQGIAWNSNNIGGSVKRAVGIGMHIGLGNLGGVIAGFIYRAQDAPQYFAGHASLVGTVGLSLCLSVFMTCWLRAENARRDAAHPEEYTTDEITSDREKGDYAGFYRYTV